MSERLSTFEATYVATRSEDAAAARLVSEVADLVSFPAAATRVIALLESPESSATEVAATLALDPALTARVLRMANSARYHVGRINTVERAIAVIGRRELRDVVLGTTAVHAFDGIPIEVVTMEEFWSHSIYCGLLAERIARRALPAARASAFTAGLLHDIGQLVLFAKAPRESQAALAIAAQSGDELSMAEAERHVLGYDHTDVGDALARLWGLPPMLAASMAHHHEPSRAGAHAELVTVVHVANGLSLLAETNQHDLAAAQPLDPASWRSVSAIHDSIEDLLDDASIQFSSIKDAILR